jgi:integrase
MMARAHDVWADEIDTVQARMAEAGDPEEPVFPDSLGGLRDPSNTRRVLRETRGSEGFAWVTSHVFRKTAATILDEAGLTARLIADQLGHSRPSMTQDVYMGRTAVSRQAAEALEGHCRNDPGSFSARKVHARSWKQTTPGF